MKLQAIDLNLLVVLDVLLRERTVTAAARRLGLSQSATSHALARLRVLLDDPVLERAGAVMVPTARAVALGAPVRRILEAIDGMLAPPALFDATTSETTFTLALDDGTQLGVLPDLVSRLALDAPGVGIHAVATSRRAMLAGLESGEIDVAVSVASKLPRSFRSEELARFRYVVIARGGHPEMGSRITLKRYLAARHVVITTADSVDLDVDRRLAARGLARHVAVATSSPLTVPALVARTDYVATVPDLLLPLLESRRRLDVHAPPLPLEPVAIAMIWHTRTNRDAARRFVRDRLRAAFAEGRAAYLSAASRRAAP